MKRYRFRLDQVLRVRSVQEDMAASELALARAAEAAAVADADARRAAIAARSRPAGQLAAGELVAQRMIWDAELTSLASAQTRVTEREETTTAARAGWMAARQRVRALEVFDERQRAEHTIEVDRDDAARVDDLVVSRFSRSAGEHSR